MNEKNTPSGTWDISLLEGSPAQPGPLICQFTNVTLPIDFQCPLTPAQVTLYREGNTFMEADPGGSVIRSPVVPASHLIYYDDFESGDSFFWSASVP